MQRTIKNPVEYRGTGLHSGKEIKIVVRPAEAGTGVSFVRIDLDEHPVVRAYGSNMKARQRRTCIQDRRAALASARAALSTTSSVTQAPYAASRHARPADAKPCSPRTRSMS